jgi:aminopeptidase YwaD
MNDSAFRFFRYINMMNQNDLNEKCHQWLKTLCVDINERNTGSQGNRDATRFFREQLESLGWETEIQEFEAVDWIDGGATLNAGNKDFNVLVSPWSKGCSVKASNEKCLLHKRTGRG